MNNQPHFTVGIDGGGTKCRAVVFDSQGKSLGEGISGPANIARIGKEALTSITTSVVMALENASLDTSHSTSSLLSFCHVSAGLAGATVREAVSLLDQWQHPFASFRFTTDLHAALVGAHGGDNGAVLVVGTGSCSAALVNGQCSQFGGHGFVIGDKGSGAWFGREGVRHCLEALDGVYPLSMLSDRICRHFDVHSTRDIVNKLNYALPAEFASAANVVFSCAKAGDEYAQQIVQAGTVYLTAIARIALEKSHGQLVLSGGLSSRVLAYLPVDVQTRVVSAQHGPEWGAVKAHC